MSIASHGRLEYKPELMRTRESSYAQLIAALVGLPLLCACGPAVPVHSEKSGQGIAQETTVQSAHEIPVRVIVKFRRAVPYRDPAFLQDITQQIQARLSYVASVSEDTHVYLLEPLAGHNSAEALKRLANLSTVLSVELDAIATHF